MKKNKKNKGTVRETIAKAPRKTLWVLFTGAMVNSDFFFRHKLKFFIILALVMFYISTKYQCQTGMEEIKRLEKQLDVVKTEGIREKSFYMSQIRETSMATIADSIRPGLALQKQPPFKLKINK